MENINIILIILAFGILIILAVMKKKRDEDNTCEISSCNYKQNCLEYCGDQSCPPLDCEECPACPAEPTDMVEEPVNDMVEEPITDIAEEPVNDNMLLQASSKPAASTVGTWVLNPATCKSCNSVCGDGKATCGAKCSTGNAKDCKGKAPKFSIPCNNGPCNWYFRPDPKCPNPTTYTGSLTLKNIAQCPVSGQCKSAKPADRVINCPTGTGYVNWQVGPVSGPCISSDGGCSGYRTRTVTCPVPGFCKGEKPLERVPCTDSKCPWIYSDWTGPVKLYGTDTCGVFMKSRKVLGCSKGNDSWCRNTPQVTKISSSRQDGCHWVQSGIGKCLGGKAQRMYTCPYGSDEPCTKNDGPRPVTFVSCTSK